MPYYRLYNLNPHSGHIDWAEEIEAADDVEAVALVRDRPRRTAVELWQEGRKVLRLDKPVDVAQPTPLSSLRQAASG